MNVFNLTRRQQEALAFIDEALLSTGTAPSFEELRIGLGYASKASVAQMMAALERRQVIKRIPGHARSITVCRAVGGDEDVQARAERLLARWHDAGVLKGYPTTQMLRELMEMAGQ